MHTLSTYVKNWRLKPSAAKTLFSAFHLYNKKSYRELNIKLNNSRLQFHASQTYLGIKLDSSVTFHQHLEALLAKITAHVALIRRLACTILGTSTKTSRISTQALVFSAAEYCALVWCWSSHIKSWIRSMPCAQYPTVCMQRRPINFWFLLASLHHPSSVELQSWHCLKNPPTTRTISFTRLSQRPLNWPAWSHNGHFLSTHTNCCRHHQWILPEISDSIKHGQKNGKQYTPLDCIDLWMSQVNYSMKTSHKNNGQLSWLICGDNGRLETQRLCCVWLRLL